MYKQAPNQNRLSHLSEVCLIKVKSFKQLNITDHSQIFQFNQSWGEGVIHLVNAATTAHMSSLALALALSFSGSSSSRVWTLFMPSSYWSSWSGAKAFSKTSDEWARRIKARTRLSMRWGSLTHFSKTDSCTFLTRRCREIIVCWLTSNYYYFFQTAEGARTETHWGTWGASLITHQLIVSFHITRMSSTHLGRIAVSMFDFDSILLLRNKADTPI